MKIKILFLTPYPFDSAPSQRFRFEQYFYDLTRKDFTYQVKSFLTQKGWKLFYSQKKIATIIFLLEGLIRRFFHLMTIFHYDYIFIHRELSPLGPPLFEWVIAKIFRKKIIYDFDDAIWLEDPDEKGTLLSKLKWKSKVAKICKWSYKVSVGNEYLAAFARKYNQNVVINPTIIDTEKMHHPELKELVVDRNNGSEIASPSDSRLAMTPLVIGWTGTHSTLQYLNPIIPVISKLEKKYDFIFLVIANTNPYYSLRSFKYIPWEKETEIDDLMKIDIGIMPLSDDDWSKGKCGFKLLQYMALQKPALASPVGMNAEIIEHGVNGFLCNSETDWYNYLEELLVNTQQRLTFGKEGRDKVIHHYSVNSNQANFLSLFE